MQETLKAAVELCPTASISAVAGLPEKAPSSPPAFWFFVPFLCDAGYTSCLQVTSQLKTQIEGTAVRS